MADRAGWRAGPGRWFIVIPDMFGNGLSSSPSNTPDWPGLVTTWDNVHAQRRLLQEVFGIGRLHAVYGWSMGAGQAYHWAACFPDAVERAVVSCGSAKTSVHNRVFLAGLMAILQAAPEWQGHGRFSAEPTAALRAFARVYAGWALSQDFYRAGLHLSALGAPDLETFLRTDWEQRFAVRRAADLYAQLQTWDAGDISANPIYGGDLPAALRAITAKRAADAGGNRPVFPRGGQCGGAGTPGPCRIAAQSPAFGVTAPATRRPIKVDAAFVRDAVRAWLD